MLKRLLGYEFLREHLDLSAFPCARPARISSVTKVLQRPDGLDVPASVAPATQAPLEHILFALKHEGINLQVLAQSLPQIPADQIIEAFRHSPASKYTRMAGSIVNITGTLTNTGILDIGSAGVFGAGGLTSLSGTIIGGTLTSSDVTPTLTSSSGTLDGVTQCLARANGRHHGVFE